MRKIFFWIAVSAFCLPFAGCKKTVSYEYPFQNPALTVEERATDIVSRLTLDEKIAQMLNATPAIERFGIPPYDWWNECLHGVANTHYATTVFPQAIALAAGWDKDAIFQMADFTADEGRAVYNTSLTKEDYRRFYAITFWSPNINIFRDPRWGRGQETYGEDPFLTGVLGETFVKGLQGDHKTYLKAAACAKHFAVHSGPEPERHLFNAEVSDYDLWDTYLPAFKVLADADVAGFMCAYNAFYKQPCCASDKLMIDILRNQWGFTGYVTSDCGAINDFYDTRYANHRTHENSSTASADALFHGTDVDCGQDAYFGLKQAVEQGLITEAQVDISLKRLFEIRIRLGMFDPKEKVPFNKIDSTTLEKKEHKDLSLRLAQQAIVLLENDGTLPLDKNKLKKIVVTGPNADEPEVQLGNYNGHPSRIITPLIGLREKLPNVEVEYKWACNYADETVAHDIEGAITSPDGKEKGFTVAFFNNPDLKGEPVYKGITEKIAFSAKEPAKLAPGETPESVAVAPGVQLEEFSSRFEGIFESPVDGPIEFKIDFDDGYRFYIDGKVVTELWDTFTRSNLVYTMHAQKGKKYRLKLEHVQHGRSSHISLDIQYRTPVDLKAVAEIQDADLFVFVGGISPRLEGEEMSVDIPGFYKGDRTSIMLPKVQVDMLKALKETGKPVIFVMMTGSAIAIPEELKSLNAIVNAWYDGDFAGRAIADVLFGDYNPSGHLPVTFYANDSDLPDFRDYNMQNRTYRYFKGKALYPFGYGLSYTSFNYAWGTQPKQTYQTNETIQCTVKVTNTGQMNGDEVAQVYIKYPEGGHLPLKELRHFERRNIPAGKTREIKVSIPIEQLAKWDETVKKQVVPTGTYSIFAGEDSSNEAITASFEIK